MDLLSLGASNVASFVGLTSTLTEHEAIDAFRRHDAGWVRRVRRPRLRSVACVFVPYYCFHVTIADGVHHQTELFAVDAVRGTLDPYHFEGSLNTLGIEPIQSRNSLTATLEIEAAWPILVDKLRRLVFQTGFLRIRDPRFGVEREPLTLHLPYWVGFYEDGPLVRLQVLDAVRQRFEGAKARALFENWLTDTYRLDSNARQR
jgi:hypothetical protein